MTRAAIPAVLGVVLAVGGSATAAPRNDFLLVLGQRAGPYRYLDSFGRGSPRAYEAARAALGRPGWMRAESNLCGVTWPAQGITVGFASMPPACSARNLARAAWYGMSLHGPRWHNRRGIRVGDPAARVRRLYPHARSERPLGTPWLVLVRRTVDELDLIVLAVALDADGRLTSLEVPAAYVY